MVCSLFSEENAGSLFNRILMVFVYGIFSLGDNSKKDVLINTLQRGANAFHLEISFSINPRNFFKLCNCKILRTLHIVHLTIRF